MPDSLLINSMIELLGNGVPSVNPVCAGAIFRLAPGFDLSAPQPTADIVGSLVLDGERPFGYRASDRTITLPIVILVPQSLGVDAGRAVLAGARELLLQTIDQQTFTLTWTRNPPPGGTALPLVFDCFRANPTVYQYELTNEKQFVSLISISFLALPYGRSDMPQQLAFASPVQGLLAPPPAPVVLDTFTTVSAPQCSQSAQHIAGPHSCHWDPSASPANNPTGSGIFFSYAASCATSNLTGLGALSVWAGFGSPYYWNWPGGPVLHTFTLSDAGGHVLPFSVTRNVAASNDPLNPAWTLITAPIPQAVPLFDYAHVTGYSCTVANKSDWSGRQLHHTHCYLDTVVAQPQSTAAPASIRGAVYTLHGIIGTSHAPLSLNFQQPAVSQPKTVILTGSGTWIPPAGVTSVKVEAVGGGGAGAALTATGPGGGGGGGEYACEPAYTLTSSSPIPYSCGAGGTSAATGPTVVQFSQDGTASWLCPAGVTSVLAECWGAGAGGAAGGGGGGGGEYAAAAVAVVPGTTYQVVVGDGGDGSNGYGASGGGNSSFGGNLVTAHGGQASSDGGYSGGPGGTGSSASTHHNGGAGGTSPSSGGGGGSSGGSGSAGNVGASGSGGGGGAGGSAVTGGGPGGAGSGGSSNGNSPASGPGGGGGGSGSGYYWSQASGGSGRDGQVQLTYTVGSGTAVSGSPTTFGATITAHGGVSAALNSGTGAAGGTGSAATVHYNGGAGYTSASAGGGGGSSAGGGGAGATATSAAGGLPPAGGGKGGAGGAAGNNAGSPGFGPGGAGGGASSTGGTEGGGAGGAGQITLTYTATLAAFKTLIAHRPGPLSPPSLTPFVSTASSSDPPDGREYPVPSLTAGVNARFGGTYSLVLVAYTWNNPAAARTVTLTVHQYDWIGATATSASVSRTFTPSTDIPGVIVTIGELTLPDRDIPPYNTSAYFTVGITDTNGSDRFLDVLLLDTQGQTCLIDSPAQFVNAYLDEPTSDRDLGRLMGSAFDRSEAVSVMSAAFVSGGPLTVNPGDNQLLCYCVEGAPAVYAQFYPRWWLDRLA